MVRYQYLCLIPLISNTVPKSNARKKFLLFFLLFCIPVPVNLAYVARSDKSVDVVLLQVIHQKGKFVLGKEDLDFHILFPVVAACNLV